MVNRLIFVFLLSLSSPAFAADDSGFFSSILNYLEGIYDAITDFVTWIGDLVVEVFKSFFIMLKDVVIWAFESLFALAAGLLENISSLFNIPALTSKVSALWGAVPPEMSGILSALGVSSALAIIAAGILIRFALQLIPFVRLGS